MNLGLVGFPVGHSLSPAIHGVFLKESGIEGTFVLIPTPPESLGNVLGRLRCGELQGLNVTMPYKRRVFGLCDTVSHGASQTGAVNTLAVRNGMLSGCNTDIEAFLTEACGLCEPFLVVGSGGASRAVSAALEGRRHLVFSRNPSEPGHLPLSDAVRHLGEGRGTVVNCTPLGWCEDDPFPVTPPAGWTFMDLNYNPGWRFRNVLGGHGVGVVTGEGMLVRQAALSFRFWTGVEIGSDVFGKALVHVRRLMGGRRLD